MTKALMNKKKRPLEFSDRDDPVPKVKVSRKIESGTRIFSARACRIFFTPHLPDALSVKFLSAMTTLAVTNHMRFRFCFTDSKSLPDFIRISKTMDKTFGSSGQINQRSSKFA